MPHRDGAVCGINEGIATLHYFPKVAKATSRASMLIRIRLRCAIYFPESIKGAQEDRFTRRDDAMTDEALCHTATTLSVAWLRYAPLLSQSSKGNIESVDVVPNEGTLTLLYFPESIKGNLVSFVVLRNHFAAALTALQMGLQITP